MKTCKNCGASINEDSRFCTQCGADTFTQSTEEQAVVNAEASAQPETDGNVNGEYYQPESAQTAAPVQSGEYYQPASGGESSTASTYTYAVPADQTPVGKGKKGKNRVGAIIAIVIVVLGILFRIGIKALDYIDIGEVAGNLSSISKGYETPDAYINSSINLKIDASKGGMEVLTDSEKSDYFGIDPDSYETFIYDFDTDEYIYVMLAEGSLAESAQNIKSFAKEIAEYVYEGESNYEVGEAYELDIAGNTFTCVDVSQTVYNDSYYGTYYSEQTFGFIKSSTMFLEISITTYPEETGHHAQDIIDQYFSTAE